MQIGKDNERDAIFWVRQVLDVIFIIGAIAGVISFVWGDRQTGLYIVMVAMVVKMAESALRIMRH